MKTEETLKQMLSKDNLTIQHNERRLILLALIKSNYKIKEAYKLNNPSYMSIEGYTKKIYRYGISLTNLKKEYEKIKNEKVGKLK